MPKRVARSMTSISSMPMLNPGEETELARLVRRRRRHRKDWEDPAAAMAEIDAMLEAAFGAEDMAAVIAYRKGIEDGVGDG